MAQTTGITHIFRRRACIPPRAVFLVAVFALVCRAEVEAFSSTDSGFFNGLSSSSSSVSSDFFSGSTLIAPLEWTSSLSDIGTTSPDGKVHVVVYRSPASYSYFRDWEDFPTSGAYRENTSTDYLTNQETTLWLTSGGGAFRTASSDVHSLLALGESPRSSSDSDDSGLSDAAGALVALLTPIAIVVGVLLIVSIGLLIARCVESRRLQRVEYMRDEGARPKSSHRKYTLRNVWRVFKDKVSRRGVVTEDLSF